MGPPTHNDPNYSNDTSSGTEEEPIKKDKGVDPDDSPDMQKLALPDCDHGDEHNWFKVLEIHLPKELFDA